MAHKNLYIPDADMSKVRKLERILKADRMSMSEWFIRACLKRLAEMEGAK